MYKLKKLHKKTLIFFFFFFFYFAHNIDFGYIENLHWKPFDSFGYKFDRQCGYNKYPQSKHRLWVPIIYILEQK